MTAKYTPFEWISNFWAKVEQTDGCWLWKGAQIGSGYGNVFRNGRPVLAHRAAFELLGGHIPDGMFLCHKCDIRNCVRPDHMFIGTNLDNARDAQRKRRMAHSENQGKAKLTNAQAEHALRLYFDSGLSCYRIAKHLGVQTGTIHAIVTGRSWPYIDRTRYPTHIPTNRRRVAGHR